jgi:hypothetical protein
MVFQKQLILVLAIILAGCSNNISTGTIDYDQIATMVAATLTSLPPATDIAGTEEVLPTATIILSSSTPTPLISTPAPSPTRTDIATEIPNDPKDYLGDASWEASFEDESNWYTFETDQASIQVEDGALVMKAFTADNYESWSVSSAMLSDFYFEITATTGDSCQGKDRYGIIARAPDPNQGYLVGISCDGYYRIRKWDGQDFTELLGWQQSEHIKTGSNQTNRLGLMADGTNLSVYINGNLLVNLSDPTYANGAFGTYIGAANTPGFTTSISNAAYWEIP